MKPSVPKPKPMPLAIDSGAHTFYQKVAAPRSEAGKLLRGTGFLDLVDHSYSTTEKFARYLDSYIRFIKGAGRHLEFCVSLDVPLNAQRSWEVYEEMTKQKVKVMPVYHYGEDTKWLDKYLDHTDYIGLGGLVKTADKLSSFSFREKTWKRLLDSKGKPRAKVHAFGVATTDVLAKYPYFSADSTTAFTWSRYGCIMLPRLRRDHRNFDYFANPLVCPVTPLRRKASGHVDGMHPQAISRKLVERFAASLDLKLEDLRDDYGHRDTANLHYMNQMFHELSEHHSKRIDADHSMLYYTSGNFTESLEKYLRSMRHLEARKETKHLAYLGTYYAISPLAKLAGAYGINLQRK